jgi:hypothetical protein
VSFVFDVLRFSVTGCHLAWATKKRYSSFGSWGAQDGAPQTGALKQILELMGDSTRSGFSQSKVVDDARLRLPGILNVVQMPYKRGDPVPCVRATRNGALELAIPSRTWDSI